MSLKEKDPEFKPEMEVLAACRGPACLEQHILNSAELEDWELENLS